MTLSEFIENVIHFYLNEEATVELALGYIKKTKGIEDPRYYQLDVALELLRAGDAPPVPVKGTLAPFYPNGIPLAVDLKAIAERVMIGEEYDVEELADYIRQFPDHESYQYGHGYGF